uniref:Ig-like domain-containing protein n=1 Tax=Chelydra serpentina TaxID=8475 RepID=A0A8C3S7B7_CHESE
MTIYTLPSSSAVLGSALTLRSRSLPLVPAAPRLSVPQRSAGTGTASSFPCHVWGFYPGDVTVTWLRDGRVLTDVTRSAPQRNSDGTFNLTLTYTFTPTASDSGSIFSCHVTHSALAQ